MLDSVKGKKFEKIIVGGLVIMGLFSGLFGCNKEGVNQSDFNLADISGYQPGLKYATDTEGTLLFDYYHATVGLPEGQSYTEKTVNAVDGRLYLNTYSEDENGVTTHKAYVADKFLLTSLFETVSNNKMWKWNEGDNPGETGAITVVKFAGSDGAMVRVSSENMPDNGGEVLRELNGIVNSFLANSPEEVTDTSADNASGIYYIDYCGLQSLFTGGKENYRAGDEVELVFDMIATDTNYSFYVDDNPCSVSYDPNRGYVIEFTMPEHNVCVSFTEKNTMVSE